VPVRFPVLSPVVMVAASATGAPNADGFGLDGCGVAHQHDIQARIHRYIVNVNVSEQGIAGG
jgi:hypothetical protein